MRRPVLAALLAAALPAAAAAQGPRFDVRFPAARSAAPLDGRLLVLLSTDSTREPRFQIGYDTETQQVVGTDVDGMAPDRPVRVDARAVGFPLRSLRDVPKGRYRVQAVLNRYETFRRADGHVVKLPPDKGEGQRWNTKPGNLYSVPRWIDLDPRAAAPVALLLDQEIPAIPDPPETQYIKHLRIRSELLSRFWGRDMYLGAHILLPEGYDTHPQARYPLVINHGHFPYTFEGFREAPPDPSVPCVSSARFRLDCYNRIQDSLAHDFYRTWTGPGFPRVLLVEIQHPTPYYDDSYAVNSAANGPYGDAIMRELVPAIEHRFRGLGRGYARFTYGGSTGGWEAMAVQLFYPDDFNGAWVACPDPIDFRAYTVVNIYEDRNAYDAIGPWKRTARPGHRNALGHLSATLRDMNHYELALGSRGRSGDQWDVWESVFSPLDSAGYPARIWDRLTGEIDPAVAAHWREHYDLTHILRRDWRTLGPKVKDKLFLYVGDMDNYYLNNAVYLAEAFLREAEDPRFAGEVAYGDRAEHCWNGDPTRPNALSRLRYHQMFIPRIMDQIRKNHPADADTLSWRY